MTDTASETPIQVVKLGDENTSDGYHTFKELYDHRMTLWLVVCWARGESWRTRRHSDGELAFGGGWFVLGLGGTPGRKQITYHFPMDWWDRAWFAEELEKAPEFDGHTSADVLDRLLELMPGDRR